MRRMLLCAEAVTLAHVARPLALAQVLPAGGWVATVACDPRYRPHLRNFAGQVEPLASIEPRRFLASLRKGTPLYDTETLERYVADDLEVIKRTRPDVIVGDFRLSLSVSARAAGVPYIALANAYWSPAYRPHGWPVPDLPITRALPLRLAQALFQAARPAAFALHSRPLNKLRRRHGLASLGNDLRRIYTDADYVAYADIPELFPISRLAPTHRFIGPVLWEPPARPPAWWEELRNDVPLIYVTLGSSGQAALLPAVVSAVAKMGATVVVATAGTISLRDLPANVRAADFLPGSEAARRAQLVVCNGGSPTCYQALCAGVPVIGIASNLDQFLNMQALERVGSGVTLRADRFTAARLLDAASRIMSGSAFRQSAKRASAWCAAHPVSRTFPELLDTVMAA